MPLITINSKKPDLIVTLEAPSSDTYNITSVDGFVEVFFRATVTGGTAAAVEFEAETASGVWQSVAVGVYNSITYKWEVGQYFLSDWEGTWFVRAKATRSPDLHVFYSVPDSYSYFTITVNPLLE